ncbi:MAG: hypothetical protein QM741_18575 [Rudaea sp.]|uniref:hypothetical protein n=1 Tax=Rudaea sp. TaxID=2136325 RepID=UPI0039E43D8D
MKRHAPDTGRFPPAPADLPQPQREQWDETVRAFGSSWWKPSDYPLLHEYLRALAMADGIAPLIAGTTDADDLRKLLSARDLEVKRACTLATKLRIAPQSRSDRHLAGRLARDAGRGAPKPWEFGVIDPDDPGERFFAGR